MHHGWSVLAAVALASSFGAAYAATDPAAVLNAYRVASCGDAWNGKSVMKGVVKIAGQGLTGNGTFIADLRDGHFVRRCTPGPAGGAQGFDGKSAWQQGPSTHTRNRDHAAQPD